MKHRRHTTPLRPLVASTGRMPNTMCASRLLALNNVSVLRLEHTPEAIEAWVRPCARGSTDNPLRCAWNSIKGPSSPRCATMISSCSFPSIRSPLAQVP